MERNTKVPEVQAENEVKTYEIEVDGKGTASRLRCELHPVDVEGCHGHLLLLQAEYRWEIFTAVDGALFYDTGKVASRVDDLDFRNLESDYGIGFRFGTRNGVFLRVEGAFGSSGGKHFVMRFGHVF